MSVLSSSHVQLEQRAVQAEQMIETLTKQVNELKTAAVGKQKEVLLRENQGLRREVDRLKNVLINLEVNQGVPQYYDFTSKSNAVAPGTTVVVDASTPSVPSVSEQIVQPKEAKSQTSKPKKEKGEKPERKEKAGGSKKADDDMPVDVSRLDFRVGRIVETSKHPDADSLYVEKVDIGEEKPRTVVSGLVRFIPEAEMQNRMVVLLCNLKPAKMRGITSEAMVMCASTPEKVEILAPPDGSQPGDFVDCDGYVRNPDSVLNPKKKIFETCAPDLRTDVNKVATYKGVALRVGNKGVVCAQTLANVQIK
ncbi:Aminoacyl tRNA synthase complex-interacting multifunctional protein 1 [Halocaridina rubra]|uniref:Aminoacyl tRNA synthase complex-interacting multifunctional protein 1 n=1 Tax=Halocaridina rubra TaxID=373956 RepID=A0AAN8X4X7_HALRR